MSTCNSHACSQTWFEMPSLINPWIILELNLVASFTVWVEIDFFLYWGNMRCHIQELLQHAAEILNLVIFIGDLPNLSRLVLVGWEPRSLFECVHIHLACPPTVLIQLQFNFLNNLFIHHGILILVFCNFCLSRTTITLCNHTDRNYIMSYPTIWSYLDSVLLLPVSIYPGIERKHWPSIGNWWEAP